MPRAKSRINSELCADCGATDPCWVSVNRAILLCTQCCSVHRSLGRHVSQVKSLNKSIWCPTQLAMVMALNSSGMNSIWEYSLLDQNSKSSLCKKPLPKDSLKTKTEFIRLKHNLLSWTIRGPKGDGVNDISNELGQQLHASARSTNLHTSARLLVQGADSNYFHHEKGSTPLHVAAKTNQISQAELLLVHGADPCIQDAFGRTAIETARQCGNLELAERLTESCFELTDRLTYYLCGRRPDHKNGQHLLVPDIKEIDSVVMGRSKLQMLPNRLFEEFAMDIYDEVDRRETELVWQNTPGAFEYGTIPFLPVQPELSTTRNQSRQKLARLSTREFNAVVLDVLIDARRRQHLSRFSTSSSQGAGRSSQDSKCPTVSMSSSQSLLYSGGVTTSMVSDDEPLYDSVASDDDYAMIAPLNIESGTCEKNISTSTEASETKTSTSGGGSLEDQLAEKLRKSDSTIAELREEVNTLRTLVERLSLENCDLRTKLHSTSKLGSIGGGSAPGGSYNNSTMGLLNHQGLENRAITNNFNSVGDLLRSTSVNILDNNNTATHNTSAAESSRSALLLNGSTQNITPPIRNGLINNHELDVEPVQDNFRPQVVSPGGRKTPQISQRPTSMYETREKDWQTVKNQHEEVFRSSLTAQLYQKPNTEDTMATITTTSSGNSTSSSPLNQPLFEEILRRAKIVTKRIQELWECTQKEGCYKDGTVPSVERIRVAVDELTAVIPIETYDDVVRSAIEQLITGTSQLHIKCAALQKSCNNTQIDYLHVVHSSAYDIAKATKTLITKYQYNNN